MEKAFAVIFLYLRQLRKLKLITYTILQHAISSSGLHIFVYLVVTGPIPNTPTWWSNALTLCMQQCI